MPIYEYRCASCEHDLEAVQKFSDPPLTDCPSCGAPRLERLLSQSSFALKGGGWYADGYGGKKAANDAGSSADKSPATANDSKGKSETPAKEAPAEKSGASDAATPSKKASNS